MFNNAYYDMAVKILLFSFFMLPYFRERCVVLCNLQLPVAAAATKLCHWNISLKRFAFLLSGVLSIRTLHAFIFWGKNLREVISKQDLFSCNAVRVYYIYDVYMSRCFCSFYIRSAHTAFFFWWGGGGYLFCFIFLNLRPCQILVRNKFLHRPFPRCYVVLLLEY